MPENWVVDAAVGSFDVWRLADGVEVPATLGGGDALEWSPPTGAPTLTIDVAEVLRG